MRGRLFFYLASLLPFVSSVPSWAFDSIQLQQTIKAPAIKNFTPTGVAFDSIGQLWVTDPKNNQLDLFSSTGVLVRAIGHAGSAAGEFQEPHAIAIAGDGRIYVADSGNARVQVFSSSGQWVATLGEKGSDPGQFRAPWSLAISVDGTLLVADKGSSRVQLFSADGVYLQQFDAGIAVDALAVDPTGWIHTSHIKEHLLQTWSPAGQLHRTVTGDEPGVKGFAKPGFIAANAEGFLYVSDADARQFREMDLSGHAVGSFGRPGSGEGQFKAPAGIASRDEELAVADARNRTITLFHLEHAIAVPPSSVPVAQIQVGRRGVLPAVVDVLAVNPDGSLHTLSSAKNELLTWNLLSNTTSAIDLKKLIPPIKNPAGITTAPSSGSLFISDASQDRVYKLDRQGKVLLEYGKDKELSKPRGLSCTSKGLLLIADSGNSRFEAFNHQGLFQFSGGEKGSGPGQLKNPLAIAWDKDQIYVADPANKKVVTFNGSGRFVRELGPLGVDTLEDPRQVAVDREGHLFVLDAARGRILIFNSGGVYIGGFGTQGQSVGFLNHPKDFALAENGDLYVAEANRIQIFHVILLPPAPKNITAVSGEGFVTLKWDPVQTRFPAKYVVSRSSAGATAQVVKETVDPSWTDDALTPLTTFFYTVTAQSVTGATSVPSASVAACAKALSGPRIEISSAQINNVFSANYKFYSREPFGQMTLHNTSTAPAQKVKLSFMVQEYMDFPSEVMIAGLHAGETQEIALKATFNNKVLTVTETTPVQAQIKVSWYSGDQEINVTRHQTFILYSRNTVRWDIKERIAAFITPNDPPILDFARSVSVPFGEAHASAPLPKTIMSAWAVFSGLSTYGISYLPRPNNPYDRVSLDSSTVDTIQFPRETLARKSGDCADVVALLASVLEAMTLTTAVLDAPGHLFLMFDTGESRVETLGLPEERLVFYAGTWWVPLEATLLGDSFTAAWRKGAEEYRQWSERQQLTPIDVHHAWGSFEHATVMDHPLEIKAPTRAAIEEKFLANWKSLPDLRWQTAVDQAAKASAAAPTSGRPWLQLGLMAIDFKRYDDAVAYFGKAQSDPSTAASASNNLGNLAYLKKEWTSAITHYKEAAHQDPGDGRVLINLARVQSKSGDKTNAKNSYEAALKLDATLKEEYPDFNAL